MITNMRLKILKLFFVALLLVITSGFLITPAFAVDNVVETTFFGNMKDDGGGCGVFTILNLVVDILSIGIGILAIIGITIVGIKYLTAGGNVEQTKKAKNRMFQIILGLVAYVLLYAGLQWLLPGGKLNTNQQCTTVSNQELAKLKEQEQKEKANSTNSNSNKNSDKNSSSDTSEIENATSVGEKMLQAAEWSAQYMAKHKFIYFQYDCSNGYCNPYIRKGYGPYEGESLTWERAKKVRYSHCSSFATLVEKKAGLLPDKSKYHSYIYKGTIKFKNDASKKQLLKNFKIVHGNGEKLSTLVKNKKIAPGDVFGYPGLTHTMIYAGYSNGKYWIYEVSAGNNEILKYNGDLHRSISGSKRIGDILHAK